MMNIMSARKREFKFTKMTGTGNDFIVMDARETSLGVDLSILARKVCTRRVSIGADGILAIEESGVADFILRIFNPDGSEAEMCGNGARCAALFAYHNGIASTPMQFETLAGLVEARIQGEDLVSIKMTQPKDIETGIELDVLDKRFMVHSINSGVPHAVVFIDDVENVQVDEIGRAIRMHQRFMPEGTNVDFVQVLKPGVIRVRTYERGVEKETLACGTGAVASAIISHWLKQCSDPVVTVEMAGGRLYVDFLETGGLYRDVWLKGKVERVYEGVYLGDIQGRD